MRHLVFSAGLVALGSLVLAPLAGAQQAQDRRYADVGAWRVTEVIIGGRFSRCVAETDGEEGPLRFSQSAGGGWGVSIPSPNGLTPRSEVQVEVRSGGQRRSIPFTIDAQGARMVTDADEDGIRSVMVENARNNRVAFEIQTEARPTIRFNVTDADGAIRAVSECRRQALAAQPVAPSPPPQAAAPQGGGSAAGGVPTAPVGRFAFRERRLGEWDIEYLARDQAGRQAVACRAVRGYEADGALRYTVVALPDSQTAADVLIDFRASGVGAPPDRTPVTISFDNERGGERFVARRVTDPDGQVWSRILVRLVEGPNPFDDKFTRAREMTIKWAGDEGLFIMNGSSAATREASNCFFRRTNNN